MSAELIGILSVGVALAGLALALGGLMLTLQSRTDKRLDGFEGALHGLRGELRVLGERVARLEGLIEGSPSEAAGDWRVRKVRPGSLAALALYSGPADSCCRIGTSRPDC